MKKFTLVAIMAIVVAAFTACGNKEGKSSKNTADEDSVAYALGLTQGQQIQMALAQMGVDSTNIDQFLKGMKAGIKDSGNKKKDAYNKGLMMGMQASMFLKQNVNQQLFAGDSTKSLSPEKFMEGIIAAAKHKKGGMTIEQAQRVLQTDVPKIQARYAEKVYGPAKKESQAFMAKIAKQPGIKAVGNGIYVKEVKAGTGEKPTMSDNVNIDYELKDIAGKTVDKQQGATMPLASSVPGFSKALTQMPEGATWEIYIPYEQGYGAEGAGNAIKPFAALHFTVTLHNVVKAQAQGAPAAPKTK